jgi:hypothetical protein
VRGRQGRVMPLQHPRSPWRRPASSMPCAHRCSPLPPNIIID